MAITTVDYAMWKHLRNLDLIPPDGRVVEIGQANWYGDVPTAILRRDIERYAKEGEREALTASLDRIVADQLDQWRLFHLAAVFYQTFLRYGTKLAIDLHGPPSAFKLDLNLPIPLEDWKHHADVLVNTGTAEHVFDQRRLWETMHDVVKPGGLMVHMMPLWGWLDHGFYNYHPTFVRDVAAANGYEVVLWLYVELSPAYSQQVTTPRDFAEIRKKRDPNTSAMMNVVFRKLNHNRFEVPMQAYYAGTANQAEAQAWHKER